MAHRLQTRWPSGSGAGRSWLGAVVVGLTIVGCGEEGDQRAAQTPVATTAMRCDGILNPVSDPLADVQWSPSGVDAPIDQDAAVGDVRRSSLRIAGRSACVELLLRQPVPSSLDVGVEFEQETRHRYSVSSSLGISLHDGRVVGEEPRSEGRPRRFVRVHASVTGNILRVRFPTARAAQAGLDLDRSFSWRLSTEQDPPGEASSWWVDEVGPSRASAHGPAEG
jgi:hypothetical protein